MHNIDSGFSTGDKYLRVTSSGEGSKVSPSSLSPVHYSSQMRSMDSGFSTDNKYLQATSSSKVSHDDNDNSENSLHPRSPLKQRNSTTKKKSCMPERIYPITEVFNPLFLEDKKKESSSRANFATILVKSFFKMEVRMTSNVNGKKKKKTN